MHTRSARSKETGKFIVIVWDWNGAECFRGEFTDLANADNAAQTEERRMTLQMQDGASAPLTMAEILMSDDELLAELAWRGYMLELP